MRYLLGVSFAALTLAMGGVAHAGESWFRLHTAPIFLSADDGANPGDSDITIDVAAVPGRAYGDLSLPVVVGGIDASHTVTISGPSGVTWVPTGGANGSGTISWPSASMGDHVLTVEVRDATGSIIASEQIEISVLAPLEATVDSDTYTAELGDDLTISPDVENVLEDGGVLWSATPAPLPNWLTLDTATGAIKVDTSSRHSLDDVVLTAVDQNDMTSSATLPFSIAVTGILTGDWVSTLRGAKTEQVGKVALASDGSIYLYGYTDSAGAGSNDHFLAKYTAAGALEWKKTLGTNLSEIAYNFGVASDGSIYLAGEMTGSSGNQFLLVKYSSAGTLQWTKTIDSTTAMIGGPRARDVAFGADGSVYVAGLSFTASAGNQVLLTKYNSAGTLLWVKEFGGTFTEEATVITLGSDGAIYVAGLAMVSGSNMDLLTAKFSTEGVLQWAKVLGGSGAESPTSIVAGADGGIYVTGGTMSAGAGGYDAMVAKYTFSGDLTWVKTLGGTGTDVPSDTVAAPDGGVFMTGWVTGASGGDLLLTKVGAAGDKQWSSSLSGDGNITGMGIAMGNDGSLFVGGTALSGTNRDFLLARLPAEGGSKLEAGVFSLADLDLTVGTGSGLQNRAHSLPATTQTFRYGSPSLTEGGAAAMTSTNVPLEMVELP